MCIRDRGYAHRVSPALLLPDDQGRIGVRFVDVGGVVSFVPVSYTHLRAHETVLDLVCRLLLEKKKKKNHKEEIRQEERRQR